jgi:ssDNA-binding Zn-finger/Zn-ribbon topoisomerase 1
LFSLCANLFEHNSQILLLHKRWLFHGNTQKLARLTMPQLNHLSVANANSKPSLTLFKIIAILLIWQEQLRRTKKHTFNSHLARAAMLAGSHLHHLPQISDSLGTWQELTETRIEIAEGPQIQPLPHLEEPIDRALENANYSSGLWNPLNKDTLQIRSFAEPPNPPFSKKQTKSRVGAQPAWFSHRFRHEYDNLQEFSLLLTNSTSLSKSCFEPLKENSSLTKVQKKTINKQKSNHKDSNTNGNHLYDVPPTHQHNEWHHNFYALNNAPRNDKTTWKNNAPYAAEKRTRIAQESDSGWRKKTKKKKTKKKKFSPNTDYLSFSIKPLPPKQKLKFKASEGLMAIGHMFPGNLVDTGWVLGEFGNSDFRRIEQVRCWCMEFVRASEARMIIVVRCRQNRSAEGFSPSPIHRTSVPAFECSWNGRVVFVSFRAWETNKTRTVGRADVWEFDETALITMCDASDGHLVDFFFFS